MFKVTIKNVDGIKAPFKADYGWRMGDLIEALTRSFGPLELTVEECKEDKETGDGEDDDF